VSGTGESYECTLCHETFVKTISDEEAMAEMEALWVETSDPKVICDDCFQRVMAWAEQDAPEILRGAD
jgi:hypothetical protein